MNKGSSINFLSFSEMEKQLEKAIEAHRELDRYVAEISNRKILTKEDTRKLSRLRKKKLVEKDKVAFLRHQLEKTGGGEKKYHEKK
ncbi:MAG: hypothetical protein R6W70_02760 [bacterium]